MRLPTGMTIFTAESHPHSDGNTYCIDFLANSMEHAKKLAEVFGFNIADGRFGTLEAVVEKTPDGLLTDWDRDVESLRADRDRFKNERDKCLRSYEVTKDHLQNLRIAVKSGVPELIAAAMRASVMAGAANPPKPASGTEENGGRHG